MKSCFAFALALLTVTLVGQTPGPQNPTKREDKCSVQGHVVLQASGQPLKKVAIQMFPEGSEDQNSRTVTDAEGHFKIEDVKPGRYNVHIERNGFLETGKHRRRFQSSTLTLKPGQELKDVLFQMQPAAVITGKIVDAEGDPVPRVTIFVTRYGSRSPGRQFGGVERANDLGEYRVPGLSPGRYLVLAKAWMVFPATPPAGNENTTSSKTETVYAPTYYPGTTDKSQAAAIELHAGDQVPANFALATSPSFCIRGTVSGFPIALGSEISISARLKDDSDLYGHSSDGRIDKDGKFEIRDVLPGSYTLSLAMSDDGRFGHEIDTGQTVEVTNTDVNGMQIRPAPNGQVRGQFRMDSGEKVDWSQTMIDLDSDEDSDSGGNSFRGGVHFAEVKSDGSFDLKNVPAGSYHLIAQSRTQALRDYFVRSVNLGGKDVSDTGFTTGSASYSLDVVLSAKSGTVEGTVLDAKDQPVADADIVAIPDPTRRKRHDLYQQDSSDQRGHFVLHGLNPGQYAVIAFEELEDDYHDPDFLKSYEGRGQSVEVKEGERKSVLLKTVPSTDEQP